MPKFIQGGRDPTTGQDNVKCPYGLTHDCINRWDYPFYVGYVCDSCRYVARDSKGRYIHRDGGVMCCFEERQSDK